jgi:uncharacterized protein
VPARSRKKAAASGRTAKHSLGFISLCLGAVALALAALLVGLSLKGPPRPEAAQAAASGPEAAGSGPALPAPRSEPAPVDAGTDPATPAPGSEPKASPSAQRSTASYRPRPGEFPHLPAPKPRYLIFVIDDAGYSMKELEAILELPFPLTVAVLPGLPNSEKAARAVRAAGKELILHQPMAAVGGQDPGPGALRLGMGRAEVERIVEADLATVPGAVGVNNHMGSAVTPDAEIMDAVAAVAKRRGIYYLDSRTTSDTAIQVAARREGIRYWERDVFLDNSPDRASIMQAVREGAKRSAKDRPAVMIGHVWSAELAQTLTDLYPQLVAEGFTLTTISRFMVSEAEDDESTRD